MFSLVEVFGGIFAVLLFVYFCTLMMVGGVNRFLPPTNDPGDYRLSWPGKGSGWVVLVYHDRLVILETNEPPVERGRICDPSSPYVNYIRKVYLSRQDHIIFGIVEGGIPTMVEARQCLIEMFQDQPLRISTVIADREFLKVVDGTMQIPPHLKTVFRNRMIGGDRE